MAQQQKTVAPAPQLSPEARYLYLKNCSYCHGVQGAGDGPGAKADSRWARNFTSGLFKVRSTPPGQLPTDEDLMATVRRGVFGCMPAGSHLSEAELKLTIEYVKALCPRFKTEKPGKPVDLGAVIQSDRQSMAIGKEVYLQLQCGECHGPEGKGDGPRAEKLKDAWGHRIAPADLTVGRAFIGGNEPQESCEHSSPVLRAHR